MSVERRGVQQSLTEYIDAPARDEAAPDEGDESTPADESADEERTPDDAADCHHMAAYKTPEGCMRCSDYVGQSAAEREATQDVVRSNEAGEVPR